MLNRSSLGLRFKVINLARPGISSQGMADELKNRIKALHPYLVISMLGTNDGLSYQFLQVSSGWESLRPHKVIQWSVQS